MRHGLRTLRDLAPAAVMVLTPAMPLRQALGMLRDAGIAAAPVLSRGAAVGVVSLAGIEARLAQLGSGVDDATHTVEEVMARRIIVMPPYADPASALRTMRDLAVDHIIVMDARGCLGLLSSDQLTSGETSEPTHSQPG